MEPILLAIFRNLQVKELFGEIEGMVSWRLSIQKDGVSRGFGFAEFKTPEGALERWEAGDAIGVFFLIWGGGLAGILVQSCDKDKGDGLRWDLYGFYV